MTAAPVDAGAIQGLLKQAAAIQRQCPARRGATVWLDQVGAERVVVGADIHGRGVVLDRLVQLAQLADSPANHLIVQELLHGGPTYPSGGCRSHETLERVAELIVRYPGQVHYLLSNHELSEATDFPICKGNKILNVLFRCGLQQAYGGSMEDVRKSANELILSAPLAARFGATLITHSLPECCDSKPFDRNLLDRDPRPVDLAPRGAAFRLVWGRDFRPQNADAFAQQANAQWLITAHQPIQSGFETVGKHLVVLNSSGEPAVCMVLKSDFRPQSIKDFADQVQWMTCNANS